MDTLLNNKMELRKEELPFLCAKGLLKIYGPTVAVNDVDFSVQRGEILALIGGNGAGKSTLTKLLSGVVTSDRGSLQIEGEEIDMGRYSPAVARKKGIRVVHQELSLCKNLTVYENFYIEQFQKFNKRDVKWRKKAYNLAQEALDTVFPGHDIDVKAELSSLSIAHQQMVEIARAASDTDAKLFILDEPTSSLPAEQTQQLQEYIKESVKKGISYIYISHRLKEIMYLADTVFIMQNGVSKYQCKIEETSEEDMVARMGDAGPENKVAGRNTESTDKQIRAEIGVSFNHYSSGILKNINADMHGGEIIILTGLEGNGQLELLKSIFDKKDKGELGITVNGKVAYVTGDRKREGIFPLWSIAENTTISTIVSGNSLFKRIAMGELNQISGMWNERLSTKCASSKDLITSLSGGNQQKVLLARALATDADIILLDDPTRGVDIATKMKIYSVLQEVTKAGKLVVWRTCDDAELEYCSRLMVMNSGQIAGTVDRADFERSSVMRLSFHSTEKEEAESEKKPKKVLQEGTSFVFSFAAAVILYAFCGLLSPAVFKKVGFELLAVGFAPFIFAALAQTFIIGLGHIDMGVGNFMGLINVVTATILMKNTSLGILTIISLLIAYSCMGLLIYWCDIPPIIITLGMSFVWLGIAYVIQSSPGGNVPGWMTGMFNFNNPLLQGILLWLILFITIAVVVYRSRYGTVLRGFGNNEAALVNSGWSQAKAYFTTYLLAGIFAMMGGIAQSSITGASDVNASSTYTMLTVAAVIVGGGYFSGGRVSHIGAVFGGIFLTMVSVLLGLLKVNTDYTATIQGLVLIFILSLRLFSGEDKKIGNVYSRFTMERRRRRSEKA